jgi:hypothetical protein
MSNPNKDTRKLQNVMNNHIKKLNRIIVVQSNEIDRLENIIVELKNIIGDQVIETNMHIESNHIDQSFDDDNISIKSTESSVISTLTGEEKNSTIRKIFIQHPSQN